MRSLLQETHNRQQNSSSLNNSISSNRSSGGGIAALPSGVLDNMRGSSALNLHSYNIDSNTGALLMLGGANAGGSMSTNHSMIGGRFSSQSNNSYRMSNIAASDDIVNDHHQPMETQSFNYGEQDDHDDGGDGGGEFAPMISMASALTEFPVENENELKIQSVLSNLDPHEEFSSGSSHSLKKGRPYRAPTLWKDTIQRVNELNGDEATPVNAVNAIAPSLSEVIADQYYNTDNEYDNAQVSWFGQRYMVPINLYPADSKASPYELFSKNKLFYAPAFQNAYSAHKKALLVNRLQKHRESKISASEWKAKESGAGGDRAMERYNPTSGDTGDDDDHDLDGFWFRNDMNDDNQDANNDIGLEQDALYQTQEGMEVETDGNDVDPASSGGHTSSHNRYIDNLNMTYGDDVEDDIIAKRVECALNDTMLYQDGSGKGNDKNDYLTYEDLCRKHIMNFNRGAAAFARETELSIRVANWTTKIEEILAKEEAAATYGSTSYSETMEVTSSTCDMTVYSNNVLEAVSDIVSSDKYIQTHPASVSTVDFPELIDQMHKISVEELSHKKELEEGRKNAVPDVPDLPDVIVDQHEVSRVFLACLQLANWGDIIIMPNRAHKMDAADDAKASNIDDVLNTFVSANSELKRLQAEQVELLQIQQNEMIDTKKSISEATKPEPVVVKKGKGKGKRTRQELEEVDAKDSGIDGSGTSVTAKLANNKNAISKLLSHINEMNSKLFANDLETNDISSMFSIFKVPRMEQQELAPAANDILRRGKN